MYPTDPNTNRNAANNDVTAAGSVSANSQPNNGQSPSGNPPTANLMPPVVIRPTVNTQPSPSANTAAGIASNQPLPNIQAQTPVNQAVAGANQTAPVTSPNPITSTAAVTVVKSKSKLKLPLLIGAVVLIILAGIVYTWYLPNSFDNKYISSVTTAYNQQATKMLAAYEAFALPVFTSNTTTYKSDLSNFATSNSAIAAAQSSTNNLANANKLTILPGPSLLSKTSNDKSIHTAMQTYINHSRQFLANFQTLVTYAKNIDQIGYSQMPTIDQEFNAISADQSQSKFLTDNQSAAASVSALITTLKDLQPPSYLVQYNTSLINSLVAMESALQTIISATNSNNRAELISGSSQLLQAANKFLTVSSTDVAGLLQNNSSLHQEILTLESENPLGISKKHAAAKTSANVKLQSTSYKLSTAN